MVTGDADAASPFFGLKNDVIMGKKRRALLAMHSDTPTRLHRSLASCCGLAGCRRTVTAPALWRADGLGIIRMRMACQFMAANIPIYLMSSGASIILVFVRVYVFTVQ